MRPLLRIVNLTLLYSHRWLGIAGCVLFIAWFFSGIVMMYARMPEVASEERLARATPLDLSTVRVSPADAAAAAGARADAVSVAMFGERPVYRFGGGGRNGPGARMVFADTGETFDGVSRQEAEAIARTWEPGYTGAFHYDGYVTEPDQWTLQARAAMPMHRFALDDANDTRLYVSEASGELVLRTTSRERFWGYLGPVIHWVYFTPLRKNGPLWSEFVIWSSLIGCVMCVTGIVWGLMRFSPSARFRMKGAYVRSPYTGWMKWHHVAGLFFGVIALTWTYSGLLSMGPFDWFQPTGGRARQPRDGGRNGGVERAGREVVTLDDLRAGYAAMATEFVPKSLELTRVQGQRFWMADRAPALSDADYWRSPSLNPRAHRPRLERRYVSVATPADGPFASFPRESLTEVARETMPGVPVADAAWLTEYDGYYYDSSASRPLPVLRVRYADPQETWLYLDPTRGGVVQRSEKVTRLRRWLYQGLHSLDFPAIYFRRPLWDVVVIALSLGGLVLSVTTFTPAWRRIVFHLKRPFVALARRRTSVARPAADPL
jgi:hypothetical protein